MTRNKFASSVYFEEIICLYWFLFWLMNGMDKFLNGRDLVLFRWFGYDRTSRFGDYFNRVDLPEEWINAVLYAAGTWEIVLSLSFLVSGWFCFRKSDEQKRWNSLMLGLSMGAFTFIGFSVFDVI